MNSFLLCEMGSRYFSLKDHGGPTYSLTNSDNKDRVAGIKKEIKRVNNHPSKR